MKPRTHRGILRLLPVFALVLAGCDPAQQALSRNRDVWRQKGPTHYTYLYETGGFLPPEAARIEVADGSVVAVTNESEVTQGFGVTVETAPSVEALFDLIESLRRGRDTSADASYDEALGYPTSIAAENVSEWWVYRATELVAVGE